MFGLLLGSRGSLLSVLALQMFLYHYLRKRVTIAWAVSVGGALVLVAVIIGVARQGVKFDDGTLTTGLDTHESVVSDSTFNYGVLPLKLLVDADHLALANGTTFLSVLTNPVPRDWWPEKPDSGGVFFTKAYTGDAWDGASNLTPTFLGEGIINFGWFAGTMVYFLVNSMLVLFVTELYRRTLIRLRRQLSATVALDVLIYVFLMWSVIALMVGEVTNVVVNLIATQMIPVAVFKGLLALSHRQHRMQAYALRN
jgi:hypothetical protein